MKKLAYEKPEVRKQEFKDIIRTSENADPLSSGNIFGTDAIFRKPE